MIRCDPNSASHQSAQAPVTNHGSCPGNRSNHSGQNQRRDHAASPKGGTSTKPCRISKPQLPRTSKDRVHQNHARPPTTREFSPASRAQPRRCEEIREACASCVINSAAVLSLGSGQNGPSPPATLGGRETYSRPKNRVLVAHHRQQSTAAARAR